MTMLDVQTSPARLLYGLAGTGARTLRDHVATHGPLPVPSRVTRKWQDAVLHDVETSGLTGRGGAAFPTSRKMEAARGSGPRPALLVNAMEGEPASGKDQYLLAYSPHLVLDGAELVAMAVGADSVVVCLPAERRALIAGVQQALRERLSLPYKRPNCQVKALPGHYISGEESALISAVAGAAGVPQFRPDKSLGLRLGRQPALVHNAETLAHAALIGRHGSHWFRQVGVPEAPGTCLVTISGAVRHPGILEVETGLALGDIIEAALPLPDVQAVLVGGYGGTWVARRNFSVPFGPQALTAVRAAMGAGVLLVLAHGGCGLLETETIARYLSGQSAGQCGPCLFGLPAIAEDLGLLVRGPCRPKDLERLRARCGLVAGRGACRHPDGAVRLVNSALSVFEADVDHHMQYGPCSGCLLPPTAPVPSGLTGYVGPK
ncbi:MAG: NADH-ubiquinone oxidoreductase-F iron-sulfur binding region domain-containing protein [Acidimicrobiales bacterium]